MKTNIIDNIADQWGEIDLLEVCLLSLGTLCWVNQFIYMT